MSLPVPLVNRVFMSVLELLKSDIGPSGSHRVGSLRVVAILAALPDLNQVAQIE